MKNVQQILKRRAGIIGMMCLLAAVFTSCIKDRNDYYAVDPNNGAPAALVSVINASTDSPPLDFFLDNNQASNFPLRYGQTLDYIRAYTGKRYANFYNDNTGKKAFTDTITLKANVYYSLYVSNLIAKPDVMLLTDTVTKPASGMATIRLVNVGPDAPAVDLGIKGGAVLAANKAYKGFSSFVPVAANTAYTLEVRRAGTSTVLVSLSNITLRNGSVYTVWLHGLTAATDQTKLSMDIQNNVYYY
jgi:hypothetical protein